MIEFKVTGSYKRTEKFLSKFARWNLRQKLDKYGQLGVNALSSATPIESGETARSWGHKVTMSGNSFSIVWTNSHVHNGVPIAIILQYGHGTGTGGFVKGRDYINPAIKPVFDKIADDVWKEVVSA